MRIPSVVRIVALLALTGLAGCSSGTGLPAESGASRLPTVDPETGYTRIVSGASDSVGWTSGSATSPYKYRFKQILPSSERFTFRDRDLTFYFRPTTEALHFQVENLQDRPVWIDWERSTFLDPEGNRDAVAHGSTRWGDRFSAQASTQIPGLQRYGNYVLPMDYLVDPAGQDAQLHRRLFPEDDSAVHYIDRDFGVDLVFEIESRPRTYTFRFRVASVIPQ